jgi:hypothetical protein
MISFKGVHFPKEVILYAVFFYVRYGVSYRDLEEIMEERGVQVDHATLNRWVINYSPLISAEACQTAWKNSQGIGKTASKTVHPDMCHDPVFCRRNLGCYLWILLPKSEGVIL